MLPCQWGSPQGGSGRLRPPRLKLGPANIPYHPPEHLDQLTTPLVDVADYAIVVDHEDGWPSPHVPGPRDRPFCGHTLAPGLAVTVPPRAVVRGLTPGLRREDRLDVGVAVDPEEDNRVVLVEFHGEAVVRVLVAAGTAPLPREDQHHDVPAVVLQRELDPVEILPDDVPGHPLRDQVLHVAPPLVDHLRQFRVVHYEGVEVGQNPFRLLVLDPARLQAFGEIREEQVRIPFEVLDGFRKCELGLQRGEHAIDLLVGEEPAAGRPVIRVQRCVERFVFEGHCLLALALGAANVRQHLVQRDDEGRAPHALVSDDALLIEKVDIGPAGHLPGCCDGSVGRLVPPAAVPRRLPLGLGVAHRLDVGVAVDPQEHDRVVPVVLQGEAVVGIFFAAGTAPLSREDEDHDVAAIVLQRELNPFEILPDDVLGHLAGEQIFDIAALLVDHLPEFRMFLGDGVEVGDDPVRLPVADLRELQELGEVLEQPSGFPLQVVDRFGQLQQGVQPGQPTIDVLVLEKAILGIKAARIGVGLDRYPEGGDRPAGRGVVLELRDLPPDPCFVVRMAVDEAGEVGGRPPGLFFRQRRDGDSADEALNVRVDAAFQVGEGFLGGHRLVEGRHERVKTLVFERLPVVVELLDRRIPHPECCGGDVDGQIRVCVGGAVHGSDYQERESRGNDERRCHGQ